MVKENVMAKKEVESMADPDYDGGTICPKCGHKYLSLAEYERDDKCK